MNYKSFVCMTSMAAFLLVACTKDNPLRNHPPEAVAQYIFDNYNFRIGECIDIWSYPKTANQTVLTHCDPIATKVANLLNEGGFGPDLTSENIQIPEIWLSFRKLVDKRNETLREDAKHMFDNVFKPKKK